MKRSVQSLLGIAILLSASANIYFALQLNNLKTSHTTEIETLYSHHQKAQQETNRVLTHCIDVAEQVATKFGLCAERLHNYEKSPGF